jgi:hypothetical protein
MSMIGLGPLPSGLNRKQSRVRHRLVGMHMYTAPSQVNFSIQHLIFDYTLGSASGAKVSG